MGSLGASRREQPVPCPTGVPPDRPRPTSDTHHLVSRGLPWGRPSAPGHSTSRPMPTAGREPAAGVGPRGPGLLSHGEYALCSGPSLRGPDSGSAWKPPSTFPKATKHQARAGPASGGGGRTRGGAGLLPCLSLQHWRPAQEPARQTPETRSAERRTETRPPTASSPGSGAGCLCCS